MLSISLWLLRDNIVQRTYHQTKKNVLKSQWSYFIFHMLFVLRSTSFNNVHLKGILKRWANLKYTAKVLTSKCNQNEIFMFQVHILFVTLFLWFIMSQITSVIMSKLKQHKWGILIFYQITQLHSSCELFVIWKLSRNSEILMFIYHKNITSGLKLLLHNLG